MYDVRISHVTSDVYSGRCDLSAHFSQDTYTFYQNADIWCRYHVNSLSISCTQKTWPGMQSRHTRHMIKMCVCALSDRLCTQLQLARVRLACMQQATQAGYWCLLTFLWEPCCRHRQLGYQRHHRDRPAAVPGMPLASQLPVPFHSQQPAAGINLCASSLITYQLTTGLKAVFAPKLDWSLHLPPLPPHCHQMMWQRRQMQGFCC